MDWKCANEGYTTFSIILLAEIHYFIWNYRGLNLLCLMCCQHSCRVHLRLMGAMTNSMSYPWQTFHQYAQQVNNCKLPYFLCTVKSLQMTLCCYVARDIKAVCHISRKSRNSTRNISTNYFQPFLGKLLWNCMVELKNFTSLQTYESMI